MELFIGTPLFEGSDEEEQIHRIVALLGMPPYSVLKRGEKTSKYFIKSAKEYVLNIKNFAYLEEVMNILFHLNCMYQFF